jgi:hypothetical protein
MLVMGMDDAGRDSASCHGEFQRRVHFFCVCSLVPAAAFCHAKCIRVFHGGIMLRGLYNRNRRVIVATNWLMDHESIQLAS